MTVAHSSSWQVITGIGLMLIGAALQWANKVVLIGGQGHISRTLQIEASAHSRAIANKHIHTHTRTCTVPGQTVASVLLCGSLRLSRMPACFLQQDTLSF